MSKHPLISDSLLETVQTTIKSNKDVAPVQEALSPMPMIAALRIGRDAGPVGSRKRRSKEEIAAAKKERSDYKVQQAFDKLKPHPGSKPKTVQTTFRTGLFGRKLKAKPEDFRKIPGKKPRPDLQFEETQLDELKMTASGYAAASAKAKADEKVLKISKKASREKQLKIMKRAIKYNKMDESSEINEGGIRPSKAAWKKALKHARTRNVNAWNDHESFTAYKQPEAYRIGKQIRRDELLASGERYRKIKAKFDKSKE